MKNFTLIITKNMENLNTTYGGIEKKQIEKRLEITDKTLDDINDKLLAIFKINNLSDENEINLQEVKLAQMFGRYNDMIKLNKQPLSMESVLSRFDLAA